MMLKWFVIVWWIVDWDKSRLDDILRDCGVERNPVGGFHKKNK